MSETAKRKKSNTPQGFAAMTREKQHELASRGGKAAHKKGTAHEWTSEEAAAAGRRGGLASKGGRAKVLAQQEAVKGAFTLPDPNKLETELGN